MTAAAQLVTDALGAGGPASIAVLGGARGTNEDAYAWARLADALDVPHRDAQLADGLPAELLQLPRATIDEAAAASTVVLLGPDLKEELPVLYLRLRHAAQQRQDQARRARAGRHRAHAVRLAQRARRGRRRRRHPDRPCRPRGRRPAARRPGRRRRRAGQPRRVGRRRGVLPARRARRLSRRPRSSRRCGGATSSERCSSVWPRTTTASTALGILSAAAEGRVDLLVLLGADPIADCPDTDLARRAIAGARRIIAVDTFLTESSGAADVVLAAAAYGEKSGTTTNLEGRVTEVGKKIIGRRDVAPGLDDRRRAGRAARSRRSSPTTLGSVEAITDAIAGERPGLRRRDPASPCGRRRDGVLAVPTPDAAAFPEPTRGRARPDQLRLPAGVDAQAVRPGRRDGEVAVAGAARRDRAPPTSTRSTSTGSASPTAPRSASSGTRGTVVLPARRRRRRPARLAAGAVQRAGTVGHRHHRRLGAGHRRAGGAPLMLAIDPLLDGGLLWTPLFIVAAEGARHLRRRPRRARCSWSGSSARSSPACRTASGPNKAGPFGLLQTLADGMKLIFKEDFLPDRADRIVYRLAPFLAFVPAFLVWSVIPLGGDFRDGQDGIVTWFGHETTRAARRPAGRASSSCWRCRRSPSTASCSPAGRAARSTRCSAPCGHRRR